MKFDLENLQKTFILMENTIMKKVAENVILIMSGGVGK